MREGVLAHQDIDAMDFCRIGEDRIEACYIAKNIATTAVDVRLASCQIWKGFEDGKLCLCKPNGEPRARRRFVFNACPNVSQHLDHSFLLARASLKLNEECFTTFDALFSQHLPTFVRCEGVL